MTRLREEATALAGVVRRDLRLAVSYRVPFATQLLSAFFTLTLFYYVSRLVNVEAFRSADAYYAFAVIGLIVLQLINALLQTPPQALRQELVAGTFETVAASPFGPVGSIVAMLVFPVVNALVTGVAMVAFAGLVFGIPVEWDTIALAVPIAALAALAFAPFGLLLLAGVLVAKQVMAGTTWLVAAIALVSGLYFPTSLLPDWAEWTADAQPFTSAVELLRNVTVGTPLSDPLAIDLARLAGSTLILLPAGVAAVAAAVRFSRRRGTLIEY